MLALQYSTRFLLVGEVHNKLPSRRVLTAEELILHRAAASSPRDHPHRSPTQYLSACSTVAFF